MVFSSDTIMYVQFLPHLIDISQLEVFIFIHVPSVESFKAVRDSWGIHFFKMQKCDFTFLLWCRCVKKQKTFFKRQNHNFAEFSVQYMDRIIRSWLQNWVKDKTDWRRPLDLNFRPMGLHVITVLFWHVFFQNLKKRDNVLLAAWEKPVQQMSNGNVMWSGCIWAGVA